MEEQSLEANDGFSECIGPFMASTNCGCFITMLRVLHYNVAGKITIAQVIDSLYWLLGTNLHDSKFFKVCDPIASDPQPILT